MKNTKPSDKLNKSGEWRKVWEEVLIDFHHSIDITIEATFCLKANFTKEEEKELNDACDNLENIILRLRRRRK